VDRPAGHRTNGNLIQLSAVVLDPDQLRIALILSELRQSTGIVAVAQQDGRNIVADLFLPAEDRYDATR
jgi:hypothetical protein